MLAFPLFAESLKPIRTHFFRQELLLGTNFYFLRRFWKCCHKAFKFSLSLSLGISSHNGFMLGCTSMWPKKFVLGLISVLVKESSKCIWEGVLGYCTNKSFHQTLMYQEGFGGGGKELGLTFFLGLKLNLVPLLLLQLSK